MNQNSEFLLKLLEKIGLPLMEAVIVKSSTQTDHIKTAENMAVLLEQSAKLGSDIMNDAQLNGSVENVLALNALTSLIVATNYENSGTLPDDSALQGMKSLFSPVFKMSKDANIDSNTIDVLDPSTQRTLSLINALSPLLSCSLLQGKEGNLLNDTITNIRKQAANMRQSYFNQQNSPLETEAIEIVLTKILSTLFTASANKLQKQGGSTPSQNEVQAIYDMRVQMLTILMKELLPEQQTQSATQPSPSAEQPTPPPPAEQKKEESPPQSTPAAPPGGFNPMSSFSAQKSEENKPKQKPQDTEKGKTPPPQQENPSDTQDTPPPAPPADPPPPAEKKEENKDNPMSFFKKPNKDDE